MMSDIQRDELLDAIGHRMGREYADAMRGHLDRLTAERALARKSAATRCDRMLSYRRAALRLSRLLREERRHDGLELAEVKAERDVLAARMGVLEEALGVLGYRWDNIEEVAVNNAKYARAALNQKERDDES